MLGRTYDAEVCSAARTLELVGERWSLLILRDALYRGTTRFADFQRDLGMASNILAKRLEGFVAAGLMEQRRYSERPEHHEYLLTAKGRELQGVIVALTDWGDRWEAPDGPPILYEHGDCKGVVHSQLHCSICGDVGAGSVVVARRGPGMPA
jgi:DNA-binding HxlR family transcriptional regulator